MPRSSPRDLPARRLLLVGLTTVLATLAGLASAPAGAQPQPASVSTPAFSRMIVFGDSNVDPGNLFALSGGAFNGPPNFGGRNSNGILVVEYAAQRMGIPLQSYAVSGARSGTLNVIQGPTIPASIANSGALSQIANWQSTVLGGGPADPNALYVFWAGSNDLVGATAATVPERIQTVRTNITTAMTTLTGLGAQNILVATRTPRQFLDTENDQWGQAMNAEIRTLVGQLDASLPGTIQVFDAYAIIADMMRNPGTYGFTEVGALCFNDAACNSSTAVAAGWVNWDAAHKTTRVHDLMADRLVAQAAAIPEPGTWAMLLAGLVGVVGAAGVARRRAGTAALAAT
jgi:phospholipase/lecithinase/hemolysin